MAIGGRLQYDEYFGFTDGEIRRILEDYEMPEAYETIKEGYDGYRFGDADIYCPWDVIYYCDELRANRKAAPRDDWSNTSGNDIVRQLI